MSHVHIHAPAPTNRAIKRVACPTCKRRTFMVGFFYEWYGWTLTCLGCGDQWTDGEMHPRPFAPKWRERNKEAARKMWRKAKAHDGE